MKEIASTIAERGAGYCSNPDLMEFIFGKVSSDHRQAIDKIINSGEDPENTKLPRSVKLKLKAFYELGSRLFEKGKTRIGKSADVADLCRDMRNLMQEHFVTITLNGNNCVISKRVIFIGTLNHSLVHPREVFAAAISDRAASVILVHNHPSGNPEPSNEDIVMTRKLVEAGRILGIDIIDHVIITASAHYSFEGNGLIKREV